ncbi:MAG: hypothetical protein ACLT1J_10430 [Mediterraneibacter gnavus]
MMQTKKQVRISDLIIPKYLPLFNDKQHKHIILTSGRAGTEIQLCRSQRNLPVGG